MHGLSMKHTCVIVGIIFLLLALVFSSQQRVQAAPVAEITSTPEEPKPPMSKPVTPEPATPEPQAPTDAPATPKPTAKSRKHGGHDEADPALTKTVDQSTVVIGDMIGFSLFVTNLGGETAEHVVLTDALAGYLDLVDVTTTQGTVNRQGQVVTVTLGSVKPDQVLMVRVRAHLTTAPGGDTGTNTGTITSSNGGNDSSNDISTVSFTVLQPLPTMVPTMIPIEVGPPLTAVPVALQPNATSAPSRLPETGDTDSSKVLYALLMIGGISLLMSGLFKRRSRW